jgi:hypothetical protein
MKITPSADDENRKVELNTGEARQARTGHNVRYVLLFSLLGVVICFATILIVFTWGS